MHRFLKKLGPPIIVLIFGLGVYFYNNSSKRPVIVPQNLKVSFLDVGQGDATLIQTTSGRVILLDGGPDEKILKEIRDEIGPQKRKIDLLIISHPHADHIAGLNYVIESYEIGQIMMCSYSHTSPDYLELLWKIKKEKIRVTKANAGQRIEIDDVILEFFWPPQEKFVFKDLNDTSVVLTVSKKDKGILFLGDLSKDFQDELKFPEGLKIEIVKIAHHGSKDAISADLIDTLGPKYAIISSGWDNPFGHPAAATINLLLQKNIVVERTDLHGSRRFYFNGNGFIKY